MVSMDEELKQKIAQAKAAKEKQQYLEHRQRILKAKTQLDMTPPALDINNILRPSLLREDFSAYDRIKRMNNELLKVINMISRIGGRLSTFRSAKNIKQPRSRIPFIRMENRRLEKLNRKFGLLLKSTKPTMDSHMPPHLLRRVKPDTPVEFNVPTEILSKYSRLSLPSGKVLHKLLRPQIYFDFYIKDLRPVGRVTIQLYTEACPEVVLAFVRVCHKQFKNNILVNRLFPGLWLDCELHLVDEQHINPSKIEYDKRALDHNHTGVLSFARGKQDSLTQGIFDFVISLKPLNVLTGKRVAFGLVTSGTKILDSMQIFGMKKSGKLTKNIILSKVGLIEH